MAKFFLEARARLKSATPVFFKKLVIFKTAYAGALSSLTTMAFYSKLPNSFTIGLAVTGAALYFVVTIIEGFFPVKDYDELTARIEKEKEKK